METISIQGAKQILERFESKKVVVVGDFYLDEYIHTESDQYSPEAPVPRAIIKSKDYVPGAAGNVASGFSALGAKVKAIGVIGDDANGKILKKELAKRGVDTSCLVIDKSRVTGTFSRILLKGTGNINQHVIRLDQENNERLSSETKDNIISYIKNQTKECDAVFIADYDEAKGTGVVDQETINEIVSTSKANNILSIGISRLKINLFKGVDVIISNKNETEKATNIKINNEETLRLAGNTMRKMLKSKSVLITLGKEGLVAFEDKDYVKLPSFAKSVVDVCGAGDSLSVTFCLSKLSGADFKEACELASFAAGVAVAKEGTATVSREEIENTILFESNDVNKVLKLEQLLPVLDNARRQKKKIVFTNGYFDLIHAGHINFLQEAKKLGDILVLAINSDESTRANKGANRPLINQDDRAKILSSFSFVDYVTIFDELTPIKILKRIQPDIVVKGGNYSKDEVVGKEIVESAGGEVVVIPQMGPSTEGLIGYIKESKRHIHE